MHFTQQQIQTVIIICVFADEATVKNFNANHQGGTVVLFQWYADENLTQPSTAFNYFLLTRLRQGFFEVNITRNFSDALCPNSTTQTMLCYEWDGFAAGAVYSVWIEMVYSYPVTGGRVTLTVTIPTGVHGIACMCT